MGKGSSQNTMGPTYGGPPGPPVNYNSLNYGGGSGLMRPTPTGSGKGGMAPAGGGGGFMGGSFGSPPQFQPTGKGGGMQTQGDLGTNMTPPPPTGLFPPPTATTTGLPDNFGQPGGPAYRPTGTEGDMVQPQPQPAVPEYLRPYIEGATQEYLGSRPMFQPRPPQGVAVPRPVAGGAPRPRPQPEFTSEMFGTTMARTPTEMAMLNKRQQELDAAAAQQADFDARQKEYDEMFGGLTEEQQAFFGNQLQSPQAQQDQAYADFLRNQTRRPLNNQLGFLANALRNRLPSRTPSRPVFPDRLSMNEGFRGPTRAELQGGTGTDMQRGTTSSNRLGQLFGLASAFGGGNPFSR